MFLFSNTIPQIPFIYSSIQETDFMSLYRRSLVKIIFIFLLISNSNLWSQITADTLEQEIAVKELRDWLNNAPFEGAIDESTKIIIIDLPSPEGELIEYKAIYSPVLGEKLRAQHPNIKSYYIEQLDEPSNNGRMTLSDIGLSAIVYHADGRYRIEPKSNDLHNIFYSPLDVIGIHEFGNDVTYINQEGELVNPANGEMKHSHNNGPIHSHGQATARFSTSIGLSTRRVVDLWIVADYEYYANYTTNVVANITAQINSVNAIITRDLNIRMNLKYFSYFNVANQDDTYFPTASNGNPSMTSESLNYFNAAVSGGGTDLANDNLSGVVTTSDFDYGFYVSGKASSAFSGQGASLLFNSGDGIICSNQSVNFGSGNQIPLKSAAGAAAGSFLITTTTWIDLVTHEMGHSLGSQHTWTAAVGNCDPAPFGNPAFNQYGPLHAYEPASGTTMMSYLGICSGDNVPVDGGENNAYFHVGSIQAINSFFTNPVHNNPTCVTTEANNNANIPVLTCTNCSGNNLVIPKNTPFYLTATGSDVDGDNLIYNWEQSDLAPQVTTANGYPSNGYVNNLNTVAATSGTALFRSFEPTANSNTRYIPNLAYLASGNTAWRGELLPTIGRTINMQFTAKDGKGGVVSKMITLTVDNTATGFAVTSQNSNVSYSGGSTQTVTWNVGGTDANGINCSTVNILLSTDGGASYSTVIASNLPNNGTANVVIPNVTTSQARIMVECNRDCVKFFNINSSNFTITAMACSNPTPSLGTTSNPTTCGGTDGSIQITGLTASTNYTLNYKKDNVDATAVNFMTDGSGNYTLMGLGAGVYSAINVTISTCTSANLGPTTLSEPADPSVDAVSDQSVCAGENTAAINFSGTGTSYTWTNTNTSIGLAANGTGNIAAFATTNSGTTTQTATITVTPIANNCNGPTTSFTITVKPLPSVNAISDQSVCVGENTAAVNFGGTGSSYAWTNNNTSIGLAASGAGNIAAFAATNSGTTTQTATIIVTPQLDGCDGPTTSFTFTVKPLPSVNSVNDQSVCTGENTAAVNFGGTGSTYAWTNNNTSIGLAASGTGNIAAFAATNSGTTTQISTITVTPQLDGCDGPTTSFTFTVKPLPSVNSVSDQSVCTGTNTAAINFGGTGSSYAWTNNNTSIGLAASGTGNIAAFATINSGTTTQTATITVTPQLDGCDGPTTSFTISVKPLPSVNAVSNQTVTEGDMTAAINFGGTGSSYAWTNDNTNIGLGASGTGDIAAFTTTNTGVSTIIVTPQLNGCDGPTTSFTITVNSAAATCTNGNLNVDTSVDNTTYNCDTVSSSEVIPATHTIIYEGCKEVVLKAGFQYAPTGSATFTARIGGCAPFTDSDNQISQARINATSTTLANQLKMTVHPNPAKNYVHINYQLKEAATVLISILDMTGKQIAVISPRQPQDKGTYQQQIQLVDFNAGMYFVVLQTEGEQVSKKMIVLR